MLLVEALLHMCEEFFTPGASEPERIGRMPKCRGDHGGLEQVAIGDGEARTPAGVSQAGPRGSRPAMLRTDRRGSAFVWSKNSRGNADGGVTLSTARWQARRCGRPRRGARRHKGWSL